MASKKSQQTGPFRHVKKDTNASSILFVFKLFATKSTFLESAVIRTCKTLRRHATFLWSRRRGAGRCGETSMSIKSFCAALSALAFVVASASPVQARVTVLEN
jgi:hypothetical protein